MTQKLRGKIYLHSADEELASIGVRSSICHAQDSWADMLHCKIKFQELVLQEKKFQITTQTVQ